jgi:ribonuclease P protein component
LRLETLKRRSEFDRVRHGQKWVTKGFILQGMPRKVEISGAQPRFGFVVAGKSLKDSRAGQPAKRVGAVVRNRARRRLKEAVRLLAAHNARPNYDYVVVGRREALHQCFADLLEDLQLAFEKVNRPPRANNGNAAPNRGRNALPKDSQRQTGKL